MCLSVYVRSGQPWPGGATESPRECDPSKEMRCDDGQCILLRRKCDNIFDCLDGSDERGCGKPPLCFRFKSLEQFLQFPKYIYIYMLFSFFHRARKKLKPEIEEIRENENANWNFYYFSDKNMIELWIRFSNLRRCKISSDEFVPFTLSFFFPHFGAFNRRENNPLGIDRRLGCNMILVVTLEAPKITSLYTLFVEASLTLVVELLWLVSRCLLTCRMEMCQWWMHSGNREMRQCYPLCWRIWRIWMR